MTSSNHAARELGLPLVGKTGRHNAITDIPAFWWVSPRSTCTVTPWRLVPARSHRRHRNPAAR